MSPAHGDITSTSAKLKARKDYKCDMCGGKIPKGSHFWRIDYIRHHHGATYPVDVSREHLNCEDLSAGQK